MTKVFLPLSELTNDRKTDLCLFTVSISGGGAERMIIYIADYFSKSGMNVDLLVCKTPDVQTIEHLLPENVRLVSLEAKKTLLSVPQYLKYLKKVKPTVVLSTIIRANIIAGISRLLSFTKHKLVIRGEISLNLWEDRNQKVQAKSFLIPLAKLSYPLADKFIGVSEGVSEELRRMTFINPNNVVRIYNPTLREDFNQRLAAKPNLPDCIDLNKPIILAASRLATEKDFPTLLRAFSNVLSERPDVQLVVLGDGLLKAELVEMTKKLSIEHNVFFLGFVPDVIPYMGVSHIFVLTSLAEGMANSLVEALASGCHVISSDCPHGPKEVLGEGQYGELFEIGDDLALSKLLLKYIELPKKKQTVDLEKHLDTFRSKFVLPQYEKIIGI